MLFTPVCVPGGLLQLRSHHRCLEKSVNTRSWEDGASAHAHNCAGGMVSGLEGVAIDIDLDTRTLALP